MQKTIVLQYITKYFGLFLMIIFFMIGLIVNSDYGISFDEEFQHIMGIVSYDYIFSGNNDLLTFNCRAYGVAVELPLVMIEKVLNLTDSRDIYLSRHLITHLFFVLSAYFCFLLVDFLYKNKVVATIGFLLIMLCPQLYAHSFFNSKDVPSAALFLICFYLTAIAFNKQKNRYFMLLGIGVGVLVNIRIMGVLLFCCILFFLVIDFIASKENRYKQIKHIIVFVLASFLALYTTWPFLWTSPIENFKYAFINMSKFPWDNVVLFNGSFINATQIDWTYIPTWFIITVPVLYLIISFGSTILLFINFLKKPFAFLLNTKERNNLIYIICFFAPVLAVIILKSVLYDGWRHLFFIYPSFVLIAVYGINKLLNTKIKKIVITVVFIYFGYISYFMISNHPFQHLYFNELTNTTTPEYLRENFELDYWGTSYKQSLEHILKEDKSLSINIKATIPCAYYNSYILPKKDRERLHFTDSIPDYFITNYRWHSKDYDEYKGKKWFAIKVTNNTINEVYKLK